MTYTATIEEGQWWLLWKATQSEKIIHIISINENTKEPLRSEVEYVYYERWKEQKWETTRKATFRVVIARVLERARKRLMTEDEVAKWLMAW
jgi:hypothetical protein